MVKYSIFLATPIAVLLLLDMIILQGGFLTQKVRVTPPRARLASEELTKPILAAANIRIKNFSFRRKNTMNNETTGKAPAFAVGDIIRASCVVENSGEGTVRNFNNLLRIPGKELAAKRTASLKPGESTELAGEFMFEGGGITYLACRADVGGTLRESTENDNNEIAALYVRNP